MKILSVNLPNKSYPIYVGKHLWEQEALWKKYIAGNHLMIVTNETVGKLYLSSLRKILKKSHSCIDEVILPDGEAFKNFDTLMLIFNALMQKKHDRKTTLIALGGGVIGDITGFAAATYRRGVHYIQVPTTLLAQVDAAIGGKTAVNHPLGKNMIGAFHQPQAVFCDINALLTLPEREYLAGMAEVIKYALIADEKFFDWLKHNVPTLLKKSEEALLHIVSKGTEIKADIVSRDETEQGVRAILNFGHTFGHAIETLTQYQCFLHGEAVAIGMVMAAKLSEKLNKITREDYQQIIDLTKKMHLPADLPHTLNRETFQEAMMLDKKVLDKTLRFIVLNRLGSAEIVALENKKALMETLEEFF